MPFRIECFSRLRYLMLSARLHGAVKALLDSVSTGKRVLEDWQLRWIVGERGKGYEHNYQKDYSQAFRPRWQGSGGKYLVAGHLPNDNRYNKDADINCQNMLSKRRIYVEKNGDYHGDEQNADCFGKEEIAA